MEEEVQRKESKEKEVCDQTPYLGEERKQDNRISFKTQLHYHHVYELEYLCLCTIHRRKYTSVNLGIHKHNARTNTRAPTHLPFVEDEVCIEI